MGPNIDTIFYHILKQFASSEVENIEELVEYETFKKTFEIDDSNNITYWENCYKKIKVNKPIIEKYSSISEIVKKYKEKEK